MDRTLADNRLIERAQLGDRDAFGELVRRHRSKAFDWARKWSRDPHLAEDIVQEALMRAFLHLGTLADMDRFLPWLQRIVRNEALMKLRRSEYSGRERTFSVIAASRDANITDWGNVDSILRFMYSRGVGGEDADSDPVRRFAHKEFLSTMRQLLRCLTAKEKAVFEAHFFDQLAPADIARLFRTSTDNVYHSISRARHKVREEHQRMRLQQFIREHGHVEGLDKAVVPLKKGPGSAEWKRCKSSFAGAVYALLPYTGRTGIPLSDVMGLTAQAFRLTVEEETIDASGPHMYFWESKFYDGLCNLGFVSSHSGDGGAPPTPYMLNKGIGHIRSSIMREMPVIGWDLSAPEFGLIYGYDDEQQLLHADDIRGKKQIPYDRLGRGLSGGMFVLSIDEEHPVNVWQSVCSSLDMAVRHAYGELTFVGYVCGLTAYECWIEAFQQRRIDVIGNAYTLDIVTDAREHAVRYLTGITDKLNGSGYKEAARIAEQAAMQYSNTASVLKRLALLFPFPSGGSPNDPVIAEQAVALLERAKVFEETGVRQLEELSRTIRTSAWKFMMGGNNGGDRKG